MIFSPTKNCPSAHSGSLFGDESRRVGAWADGKHMPKTNTFSRDASRFCPTRILRCSLKPSRNGPAASATDSERSPRPLACTDQHLPAPPATTRHLSMTAKATPDCAASDVAYAGAASTRSRQRFFPVARKTCPLGLISSISCASTCHSMPQPRYA